GGPRERAIEAGAPPASTRASAPTHPSVGRHPPVAVAREAGALRWRPNAVVQLCQELHECRSVRGGAAGTPRVRVVHVMRVAGIVGIAEGAGLLLPLEPRLAVGDRAVAVVHEPR